MISKAYQRFMRVLILGLCFLGFGMFSSAGDVLAEEWIWKIHVPIELKELPKEVKSLEVRFRIYDNQMNTVAGPLSETVSIGSGGNLSKVVTFLVYPSDIKEGKLVSDATKYKVYFEVISAEEVHYIPNEKYSPGWAQAKPGTEYVTKVKAPLLPPALVEDVGALLEIYQAAKK